ncbi:MAG: trigger factor [Proteobacteria bacterium]|nr:trigger factor [Pseudomonadota bacterium]NCA29005.1 trigger factor [Pseudomonadota bacterium]
MEAQIKNTFDKKLRKEFSLILPKELVNKKIDDYIEKVKGTYNIKGFRKGQVPANIIKEKHGVAIMADEAEKLISENIRKIVADNKLKLALQPKVDLKKMELGHDIEIALTLEIFPEVPEIDLKKIKVVKREIILEDSEIQEETKKFAKYFCKWTKQEPSYKAKLSDAVKIDYVGKIDGEEFEGGSAKDYQLELGSKSFIDDFEEQLVGKKGGDKVTVKVKFPKDYHSEKFAGKSAEFAVSIHEVLVAELPEITDEFVKEKFGFDNKNTLQDKLKQELEKRNQEMSTDAFKIELFDFLNKKYDFDLPTGMVEEQTKSLWKTVEDELKTNPNKFKNDKEKDKAREAKSELAKKLIRSGIILSKICELNKIEVTKEDLDKELQKSLARFPGQEKQVIEYYQKNPQILENIRLNAVEDKAINFLINLESTEKKKTSFKDFEKFYKKLNESQE